MPHIYACQKDEKEAAPPESRAVFCKRCHPAEVEEILNDSSATLSSNAEEKENVLLNVTDDFKIYPKERTFAI